MKKFKPLIVILVSLSNLLASAAFAGSILELATTEYALDPPVLGSVQITTQGKSSHLEIISISSNESGGMIYNEARQEIIAIDHDRQEYYVITQEQMNQMAGQVEQAMQQMEAALAELPPEEREFARKMMEARMPVRKTDTSNTVLRATGESDTIAGYECDGYDVMNGENRVRDICITPWENFPEGQEVAGAMKELGRFFESMREAFSNAGGLDLMDRQKDLIGYMKELNGYPVRSRDYNATGEMERETMLTAARNEEVDAALFEPPANYQKQALQ